MDFADKTVLLYDSGLFISWAETLTRYYGRVMIYVPYKNQFVMSNQMRIGYGLPNVEHINPFGETQGRDFWDVVNEEQIDLFIFLDVGDSDIQKQLVRMGKRVWGSRNGDDLELYRADAKQTFEKLGLPQQPWETCTGTDELRRIFEKADKPRWVKVSGHRGDIESFKFNPKWPEDAEQDLRRLEDKLGGVMQKMEFCVEDEITPAIEIGYDGPAIDGEWPVETLVGVEQKDEGYFGAVLAYDGLPEQARKINSALSPILANYEYRNFLSTEVRIPPDSLEPYLIDMTCRAPSPPNEGYQEIVENWGEIFWYGAEGILVPWSFKHKYLAMGIIHNQEAESNAEPIRFETSISQYVKLKNFCQIDGVRWVLPQPVPMKEVGAIVATSDDPLEAIGLVHERAKKTNQKIGIESISKAISSFQEGIESGVTFEGLELPKVEEIAKVTA